MNRRAEMKPGKPLKRKLAMPRGGFNRPSPVDKPAIRKTSSNGAAPKSFPASTVRAIKRRSEGLCEIGLICLGGALAMESAHRLAKQSGGVGGKNTWSDKPSNGLRACVEDHDLVDGANGGEAFRLGLKVRHGVARPYEVPVRHRAHGWVLLDDNGGHRPAPAWSWEGEFLLPVIGCTDMELLTQSGAFADAMERFGHLNCPGWSPPRCGPFTCGCADTPFVIELITQSP